MTTWSAGVAIFTPTNTYDWTVEQNLEEVLEEDEPTVLDDLRVAWAMPGNGIYPTQPQAVSAEFTLNLPSLHDYADIVKGCHVAITIKAGPGSGYLVADFAGRLTDVEANPRDRAATDNAGGVTLALSAIDYTVDPAEQRAPGAVVIPTPIYEYDVLQSAFYNGYGGVLDGDVDGIPDLWTSRTDIQVPEALLLEKRPDEQVAQILLQAVNDGADTRMIVSPLPITIRAGSAARRFTLDTIDARPDRTGLDVLLDADLVDIDISWTSVKGDSADRVVATFGDSLQAWSTLAGASEPYIDIPIALALADVSHPRAPEVADFYLPDDVADTDWQIKGLRLLVDQLDDTDPADLQMLFPRWGDAEGDPGRGACYSQRIWVDNADPTVIPFPPGPFSGVLAGAAAQIQDGLLEIDLALRAVRHHDDLPD